MQHDSSMRGQSEPAARNRRRRYLINSTFQWKYTLTLAVTVFLITSALSSVLYGLLHQQARMRVMNPETYTANVGTVMLVFAIAFGLVSAMGVGFWCFIVTHRICGPLFVMDRYLRDLGDGCVPKPRPLRRKDEFKELYATFTRATDFMSSQKRRELTTLTEMAQRAAGCKDAEAAECHEALASMADQLDLLRREAADVLGEKVDSVSASSGGASVAQPETAGVS